MRYFLSHIFLFEFLFTDNSTEMFSSFKRYFDWRVIKFIREIGLYCIRLKHKSFEPLQWSVLLHNYFYREKLSEKYKLGAKISLEILGSLITSFYNLHGKIKSSHIQSNKTLWHTYTWHLYYSIILLLSTKLTKQLIYNTVYHASLSSSLTLNKRKKGDNIYNLQIVLANS